MDIAYLVKIKGRVTGVGFRYAAMAKAGEYKGMTGYVRNVCEGEVEVVLQGAEETVELMLEWLRRGPDWARVDSFAFSKVPIDKTYTHFQMR